MIYPQLARPLSTYKGKLLLVIMLCQKVSTGYCYLFAYVKEWAVEEKWHFQKFKNHITVSL